MEIPEPLKLTCPSCEHQFECSLAWILQNSQVCPACGASLASIRDPIERMIATATQASEDVSRVIAMLDEFKIEIEDHEVEMLRTFSDAHYYVMRRIQPGRTAPHRRRFDMGPIVCSGDGASWVQRF